MSDNTIQQRRGFDFLTGPWAVTNRRLVKPLTGSDEWDEFPGNAEGRMVLGGTANLDEIDFPTKGYSGLTLRLYDEDRDEWSLHWASSRIGAPMDPPVIGRFTAPGYGEFFNDDVYEGRPIRVRYRWSGTDTATPKWEQSFQLPGTAEWEANWTMDFRRP